jgi:hypothetical protein
LELDSRALLSFSRRLSSSILEDGSCGNGLIFLQASYERPECRVDVAHHAGEGMVPPFEMNAYASL